MEQQYTRQDATDAYYAAEVNGDARAERTTPEAWIRSWAVSEADTAESLATYARGKAILDKDLTLKVVSTARFTATGEGAVVLGDLERDETLVSPAVAMRFGHIGTMQAYRWVALARRKTGPRKVS